LTEADLEILQHYDWPGNVRELAHVIERAVILGDGQRLPVAQAMALARPRSGVDASPAMSGTARVVTAAEMRRLEQENIQRAIECASGRIYGPGGAAELLGLKPTTLAYRMKALGIPRPRT
jgi:transcriptional regulator with GAF, ATPase, and Fis domain